MTESAIIAQVRRHDVERDGTCRVGRNLLSGLGPCDGPSEWAHLNEHRRCHTRGLPPEQRHTIEGTAMLCKRHHMLYDGQILGARSERLYIEPLTDQGAEGPLRFTQGAKTFSEPMRVVSE